MDGRNRGFFFGIALLLVVGMGFGGYFLGRYLDTQALAKQNEQTTKIFKSLGVEFKYPGNWVLNKGNYIEDSTGRVDFVRVVSPSGSYFYYSKVEKGDFLEGTCDASDVSGTAGSTTMSCVFKKSEESNFARYKVDEKSNTDNGTYWAVAEPSDSLNADKYSYNSKDSFYYQSMSDTDLVELDKIMESVKRN
ncbi:hypothetical protein IT417_03415 [bacterium]|nr:hypothetical protein [bacterium]